MSPAALPLVALPLVPEAPGLWRQVLRPAPEGGAARPALFLDRDGVVVEEVGYLHRIGDLRLISGAAALIRACNAREIPVILVTNQSGIGRGYYDWTEFAALQDALLAQFAAAGAHFEMVLACAYHPAAKPPYAVAGHDWRKPGPGMLREAAKALRLDLARSWIVGDAASDIAAGRNAGLAGGLHVLSGHGAAQRDAALDLAKDGFAVLGATDIAGAGQLVKILAAVLDQNHG
jgi:D-glycero-D-manno-heptose 1,7-bisphosphate phosphatase